MVSSRLIAACSTVLAALLSVSPSIGSEIAVFPGTAIQPLVDANPAGTVFRLKAGTHNRQSVVPKSGDQFIGEPGTIMHGGDAIEYAFMGQTATPPTNVRIQGLVIEHYNSPLHFGPVRAGGHLRHEGGAAWTIESCEIRYNAKAAIRTADRMRVLRCNMHHNGWNGLIGFGDDLLIEGNEISYNNTQRLEDGGGGKIVGSDRLVVRGNFSHHNYGRGLWTDINNINTLYENNIVEDNLHDGIFHEISYKATIRNNFVARNGGGSPTGWLWGSGILISESPDVEVYGNTVVDNANGICAKQQVRGEEVWYGPHDQHNLYAHHNIVRMSKGGSGVAQDIAGGDVYFTAEKANRFDYNTYHLGSLGYPFWWSNTLNNETAWRSAGQDLNGTFYRTAMTDIAAPIAALTYPSAGMTLSGTVVLSAIARDDVGVAAVQFLVDDVVVAQVSAAPFRASWDARAVTNGAHVVKVIARDTAGKVGISPATSVTIQGSSTDTTAPLISSVNAGSITASGAVVTWTTDEASDSQVEYGLSTSYGASTSLNAALVLSHGASLSSLTAATTYHYRVKCRDAVGNLAVSADRIFTTASTTTTFVPPIAALPGTIQSENFASGGEGVAYHDIDTSNNGGAYRTEGVDIKTTANGGYAVGWMATGEWLCYVANVSASGTYDIGLCVATTVSGGSCHLECDGVAITTLIAIPNTGDWQVLQTVNVRGVALNAGRHQLRLVVDTQWFDLDRISVQSGNNPPTNQLVGHWKLDETAGTLAADSSGAGHTGVLYNGALWATGKIGNAVRYDGIDDRIRVDNVAVATAPGASNSVCFWMQWDGRENCMPFGWNGTYDLWLCQGSFGFNTGQSNILGVSSAGFAGQWTHVAAVFPNATPTAANARLYINGVAQSLTQRLGSSGSARYATPTVHLSGWGANTGYAFNGRIDDLRIYSRELTASEVAAIANVR
jgi:hypothetical protein